MYRDRFEWAFSGRSNIANILHVSVRLSDGYYVNGRWTTLDEDMVITSAIIILGCDENLVSRD